MQALFSAQPQFLKELLEEVSSRTDESGLLLKAVHELSRKPELTEAIRMHSGAWISAAENIALNLSDRPIQSLQAKVMLTNLELMVGIQPREVNTKGSSENVSDER